MVGQLFESIGGTRVLKMGVTTDIVKVSTETLGRRPTHLVFGGFQDQVGIVPSVETLMPSMKCHQQIAVYAVPSCPVMTDDQQMEGGFLPQQHHRIISSQYTAQ